MCGIAGYLSGSTVRGVNSQALHAMAESIAHRGPDGQGFFETSTRSRAIKIGLAHRRLAIIDLVTGDQPMTNEDGSIQLVFNGEIYNFSGLRNELIKYGHHFRSNSDTETIVHAYEQWGVQCVNRFRGMFAFALWDSTQERLFLARDRYGKKPLYLYERGGLLLFASEIKSLLSFPGVEPKVDPNAIWSYFSYRYVPAPATLFAGVRKLMPGTFATWESGRLIEDRYFSPPDGKTYCDSPLSADPVGAFLDKLEECVSIRMVSDVPFGAFLSGGIDSSAVVGLMSRYSNRPVQTFSVGFTESSYSELGYAREIATQFKTDHHELTVSEGQLITHLPGLIRFRDAPVGEPSDIPIYLLSKEASSKVKMVLTGEGSDEILGGYSKHAFEHYVATYQKWFPTWLRQGIVEPLVYSLPYRYRRAKTAIVNLGLENREERMYRWFGALSEKERDALIALHEPVDKNSVEIQFATEVGNSPLRNILYFDQTSWLPDNLLERGDRMTMAASIEARMPFMDHELAELVSSYPDNYRLRGKTGKWILREAMKRLLPEKILNRPKVGFRVPVNEWFQGPMKEYLCDHLLTTDSRMRNCYKQDSLNKVVHEHIQGRQNHEKLLWCMLNLEIWAREYSITL